MIAAPEGANNTHLEALSRLSTILMKEEARERLMKASSPDDVLHVIDSYDREDEEEEQNMADKKNLLSL